MADLVNVEAEQVVLGSLLLVNEAVGSIGELRAHHFCDPVHGRIFAAIMAKVQAGDMASPVTLRLLFQDDAGVEELGGPAYLARLAGAASTHAVRDCSKVIMDLWARRGVVEALQEAQRGVHGALELQAVASKLDRAIAEAVQGGASRPLFRSFLRSAHDAIMETNAALLGEAPGVSTGLAALDEVIGSLMPGRAYFLGGRPSMGKTALAATIAFNVAKAGHAVTFASLEMLDSDLTRRSISQMLRAEGMRVPYFRLERGNVSEAEMRAAIMAAKAHETLPIRYVTHQHRELSSLAMALRAAHRAQKTGLIVIDYLQLVTVEGARTTFDRVSAASKAIKALAMDLGCPVLCLSQLSRSVEERDDKRPRLSDLRASGEIEEDADAVIFAFRPGYYAEREGVAKTGVGSSLSIEDGRHKLEAIVAKNRGGPVSTAFLRCEIEHNWIEDWPKDEARQIDIFGSSGAG